MTKDKWNDKMNWKIKMSCHLREEKKYKWYSFLFISWPGESKIAKWSFLFFVFYWLLTVISIGISMMQRGGNREDCFQRTMMKTKQSLWLVELSKGRSPPILTNKCRAGAQTKPILEYPAAQQDMMIENKCPTTTSLPYLWTSVLFTHPKKRNRNKFITWNQKRNELKKKGERNFLS